MAFQETRSSRRPTDSSHLAVAQSLRAIPSLEEALNPDYMLQPVLQLAQAEAVWKLEHSVRVEEALDDVHTLLGSSAEIRLANQRAAIFHDVFQVVGSQIDGQFVSTERKIALLNKPGLLTDDDWRINHYHPLEAAAYLGKHGEEEASELVVGHHSYQGDRSYPFRAMLPVSSEAALLERDKVIFAAVDTTDALATPRPYPKWVLGEDGQLMLDAAASKAAWTADKTRGELEEKFGPFLEGDILDLVVKVGYEHAGKKVEDYVSIE
jgi:hypothetical protein